MKGGFPQTTGASGSFLRLPVRLGRGAIALRSVSTRSHVESVDLSQDYMKAFDGAKVAHVGPAVLGEADDTNRIIRAAIGNLNLQ